MPDRSPRAPSSTCRDGTLRVGVDVGGTFTDVCLYDGRAGRLWVTKLPTEPADQARSVVGGIREALRQAGRASHDVAFIGHGTTVALNALLERKGARIAFVTTRGFRDVLELGRQKRPELFDFFVHRPDPLAPRSLRYEVPERTQADGTVAEPVTGRGLQPIIRALRRAGVDAVAIGFLNAYRNPANEQAAKQILEQALPALPITCSHEVAQEFREFERFSSTAMNAYLIPRVARYMTNLTGRFQEAGIRTTPLIFQSNGAVVTVPLAARIPIRTLMSGPAGGVLGAAFIARQAGFGRVITFDMGGTSTDISLIEDGVPSVTSARSVDGYPVMTPSFDVRSIGAGGGSIAWVDTGGFIKVGPRSAGAVPGPACYGRGGRAVTVTDSNMALGYLNPRAILGGAMQVDAGLSLRAVDGLAETARLDRWTTAAGVIRIVTANIARLVRLAAFERGRDPRDFVLMAFGGAGPLHAGLVARELGIRTVFVPGHPGLLCALGMLVADIRADFSQTCVGELAGADVDGAVARRLAETVTALERRGESAIREGALGLREGGRGYTQIAFDLRYKGQNYEIAVPVREGLGEDLRRHPAKVLGEAVEDFHHLHERIYGYASREATVELVTVRLGVGIEQPKVDLLRVESAARDGRREERRLIRLVDAPREAIECPVLDRWALGTGRDVSGPAILDQMDTTTLILPGQVAVTDGYGNLIIREAGA